MKTYHGTRTEHGAAVIVEIGYVSNADQERHITGNEFQNTFVQAIVDAVLRFRDFLDAEHRS